MSGFGSDYCNGVTEDGISYGSEARDSPDTASTDEVSENNNMSFSEYVEKSIDNT